MSELRRIVFLLIISTLLSYNIEAKVSKPVATRNSISFTTSKGQLTVTALAGDAWRIQCVPADLELPQLENLIYTQESDFEAGISIKSRIGHYLIISNSGNTRIKISKRKEQIALVDSKGKVIVEESPRSRLISTGQTGTLNSLAVSQSFVTGTDEFLFGTGQFQDGYLNIRGLTRRHNP